jgi:uncharacterized surface protein with fasciclin (FAS1) repeats
MLGRNTVTAIIMGAIASNVSIVQSVAAETLSAKQIRLAASEFVVKIGGADGGSGFIVHRNGDRYTVLTNDHVIRSSRTHTVTTHDGRSHTATTTRLFSSKGFDLAEIQFESSDRYQVSQPARNPDYTGGSKIYAVGWNAVSNSLTERKMQFLEGTISGSLDRGQDGYIITMNLTTVPGMSGSPLLDESGGVIGIYGSADRQKKQGTSIVTFSLGIPISSYQTLLRTWVQNRTPRYQEDPVITRGQPPTLYPVEEANTTREDKNIFELVSSAKQFKILAKAIKAADLVETLSSRERDFTLFAPNDRAFADVPEGVLQKLFKPENKDVLRKIITYHIILYGGGTSQSIRGNFMTLEGSSVNIIRDKSYFAINGSRIIKANVKACNGSIHVIEKVILPRDLKW